MGKQVARIAINSGTSARLEIGSRKPARQHSYNPDPCTLRRHRVVWSVADHHGPLGRYISRTEKGDSNETGAGLVVLDVIAAGDGIDEISNLEQREVMVELIGG